LKYNLKNRPHFQGTFPEDVDGSYAKEWFAGLEKELRKMRKDYKKHGIGDPVVDMLFKEILGD
jgi:hypothetical protein